MLLEELRRVFLKRRFLWILLVSFLLEAVLFLNAVKKNENLDSVSQSVFQSLMHTYGGELTAEKESEIETLIFERESLEDQKQALQTQYENGSLTAEEYKAQLALFKDELRGTEGFQKFIALYETAAMDTRYLADTALWEVLLQADRFNPVYVLLMILFCFLLGVCEEETGINRLLVTTAGGKRALQRTRILFAAAFTVALSLILFGGKLLLALFFRLDGFTLPLHSTEMFRYSTGDLTLLQGYLSLHLVRTLGGLLLAYAVLLIGELTRSSLYTVFLSLVLVFIPGYLLRYSRMKYLLPFPSSLLTAGGYFGASEPCNFILNEAGEMLPRTFSGVFLFTFFSLTLLLTVATGVIVYVLWTKRRRTGI